MDEKKLTDKDLLQIPSFLKRDAENNMVNTPQPAVQTPAEPIVEAIEQPQKVEETKPKRPSIQDRMRTRMFRIVGDLDDEFEKVWARDEDPKKFKAYNYFLANDIPGAFMKMLKQQVDIYIDEQSKGLQYRDINPKDRTDEQQDYVEGYETYSKSQMKQHITWWHWCIHTQIPWSTCSSKHHRFNTT